MVQQITDQSWQAEARSEETRQFIRTLVEESGGIRWRRLGD